MVLTIVVAEASYRFLESPVRQGIIGRWWSDRASITYWPIAGGVMLVGVLALFYVNVDAFNRFEGGDDVVFELDEAATDPAAAPDPTALGDSAIVASPSDAASDSVADTVVETTVPIVPATSARHGDRRRLAGQRAGDQSARRDRQRVPECGQRQCRRMQRVRLRLGPERGEVREQLLDL